MLALAPVSHSPNTIIGYEQEKVCLERGKGFERGREYNTRVCSASNFYAFTVKPYRENKHIKCQSLTLMVQVR